MEANLAKILKDADEASKEIYDAIVRAFAGKGINAIEIALQKVLADWALGTSQVVPEGTPKEHLDSLVGAVLARIAIFLERHPEYEKRH